MQGIQLNGVAVVEHDDSSSMPAPNTPLTTEAGVALTTETGTPLTTE